MKPISIISQALFDKVRSRFNNLEMGDETGAVTIDPEQARFFDFDFIFEGNNLGRVSISINDSGSLKVYFSQGITKNQDDPAKKEWFNFLKEMRFFSMRRLLRFDTRDIAKANLDKTDFQHLAKTQPPKESDMTTMNETKKNKQDVKERPLNEFATSNGDGSDNYFQTLASAWYNGTFDSGSLQKGIKSQEDIERLLNRGIVCPDGKTRKMHIDYNSDFDGVEIYSDDYYEYGDDDDTIDSRTGQKWGPYDHMEFSDDELSEGVSEAGYGRNRGYDQGFASPTAPSLRTRPNHGDDERHELDDLELKRNRQEITSYNITIDGKPINPKPIFGRSAAIAWGKEQVAAGVDLSNAMLSPVRENVAEGRWSNKSSKKTSRAVAGKTEVIVRHSKPVDEEYSGSRSQKKNIKAIYIQNADGERFKYPFIHTAGAFAMAQHVDHGGVPHDPAGQAIVQMSEEIAKLGEFQRKIHKATLHQDASGITERAMHRMNELKAQVAALGKKHHYQNWMETFSSDSMMDASMETLDAVTMEQYKQKFTQTNFQEELAAYFPLLHKIMSETNKIDLADYVEEGFDVPGADGRDSEQMGQISKGRPDMEFQEWAEAVEQGKLTVDQIAELKQAISELPQGKTGPELKLGPAGTTAIEFFQGVGLDDNELEEKLKDMANVDAESDALGVFKIWCNENYPELAVALGISDTDTGTDEPAPDAQQAAPEQPTAENEEQGGMPNKTMPTREAIVKEVAKLVKSRFNEDNPEVGPFNGAPNIALDVKKKCAEMFGDKVGDQCEQLALEFMEKLSQRWEQKHGHIEDDGLARLRELLGNVKAKVEGIGDKTDNGHAPGNNIMSAEEGIGTKLLGGAALIAAMWGVNNHMANQAYEASPQLQKLTQFYQQAEAQHNVSKMKELKQRIEDHKMRLDLGRGEVMDKTGNPKEIVPEMADILKLSGLTK